MISGRRGCRRLGKARVGSTALKTLVSYRLIDPGSEWRLHRQWYEQTAVGDLLGEDFSVAHKDTLYRCLDKLLAHKSELFSFLRQRWQMLFQADFEVLLYDLTSSYFECNPPEAGKRRFGHSRDHRSDCVQVVIALIVTPEGFPLAYEVMPGNTSDKTTLHDFLQRIEAQYGKARRTWVMDRGIPTEEVLAEMRTAPTPTYYLVGTPRGRLSQLEKDFLIKPWAEVRDASISEAHRAGWRTLRSGPQWRTARQRTSDAAPAIEEAGQTPARSAPAEADPGPTADRLGAARKESGPAVYRLIDIQLPNKDQPVAPETFCFKLNWQKLREARRREGSYLLRSNLTDSDPAKLWTFYLQLVEIEQAFKELKGDLAIRPIYHQTDARIEAHIFVAFLAYCLQVTLKQRLRSLAPGLTPRSMLDKMAAIQMVDVHLPTTDGRTALLSRYTEPEPDQLLLLRRLKMELPAQPPPRVAPSADVAGAA